MNKYAKISILTSVAMLPFGILTGNIVAAIFKSSNPDRVDVTMGLAYLRHILLTAMFTIAVLFLISLFTAIKSYNFNKEDPDRSFALVAFTIALILTIAVASTNKINSNIVEDAKGHKSTQFTP